MRQFDYWASAEIAQQQRQSAAHVERALLIREALAGQRGRINFYQPLFISVGKRLEKFGANIQARYSENLEIGHSGTLASQIAR